MAKNRANPSAINNNSMINGLHRQEKSNSDSFNYIDPKTIKEIGIVNKGLARFAETLSGNLEKYNKLIIKSSKELVDTRQKLDKDSRELDEQLAEMKKHYFGKNKKVYEDFEKQIEMKKVEMEKEYEDLRISTRKEFLKQQIKFEKEQSDRKFVESEYVKNNPNFKLQNKYNSELAKLQESFLEVYGENYRHTRDYNKALTELNKDSIKWGLKESFKTSTEKKQLTYIDSKFAKNNNLKSISNDYYSELEKLKSSAVDAYGDKYATSKEYKQALMNLNDKYAQDMKEAWKEDFKENHKVLGGVASGIKETFDRNKEVLQGFLGPLNLFITPMKEFFGGFGLIFKGIKGGAKWLIGKFTKKNPTANDVMKSGAMGVGALWIGNKLEKLLGEDKENLDMGSLVDKFKNLGTTLSTLNGVVKSLSGIATTAGLALVVKDAMAGWNKAEEWGTENWASMLGAIVGGTSSGASGAVQGAIKYALLGSSFGLPGILVGGIMGGILGFFGGKFWSQGLQDVKDLLTGKTSMTELRKKELLKDVDKNKNLNEMQKSVMYKLADTLSEEDFVNLGNNLSNKKWGGALKGTIDNWLKGNFDTLNEDELVSLLQYQTGFQGINKTNVEKYKEFFKQLHGSFSDVGLANIYKNNETLAWNMMNLSSIANSYKEYKNDPRLWEDDFNASLESMGFYGGVNSEQFKKLLSTGLLDLEYKKLLDGVGAYNSVKRKNRTNEFLSDLNYSSVDDAIIKTDGSIIKTNPKDTLVALKDVPLSIDKVREENNKNLNSNLSRMERDGTLEKKLTTIIEVLSKLLAKDVSVQLPPQTRNDLDMLMCGGMI